MPLWHSPSELTFDTGRFVPESYSSSSGEPGTPGSQREALESEPVAGVPIADLLVRRGCGEGHVSEYDSIAQDIKKVKGLVLDTKNGACLTWDPCHREKNG